MRLQLLRCSVALVPLLFFDFARAQSPPPQTQSSPPQASTLAQKPGAQTISLDDAIQMALQHNHNLLAARTTIQQSQAEEITANLRPNPVLLGDRAVLAGLPAQPVQRGLPRQHGAVRPGRQLSV